jgi:hypothetical protein
MIIPEKVEPTQRVEEGIGTEWGDEIRSRAAEMDEGRVPSIPHHEVMQRFRDDIGALKDQKRA